MLLVIATAIVASAASVGTAQADNYGGVSSAYKQQMINLVYANFGHNWKGDTMVRCVNRESGFNPRAANWHDSHGGSFGLFQINGIHDPAPGSYATKAWISKMMNPYENIKVAVRLARGGLGPWGGSC
jgi:hypothetical protein